MKICGLDNSVNSPGVVWYEVDDDSLDIKSRSYVTFTTVKKNSSANKIHFKKDQFNSNIEQYIWNRDNIIDRLGAMPDYVAFEDYAYASVGKVFNIAESTAALKIKLYESNVNIRLHDPCSLKMFASGFGNADKVRMRECYDALPNDVKLPDFDGSDDNVVDAYYLCEILLLELKLRKGLVSTKELPENVIKVFNRVTKAFPENILSRDFIHKKGCVSVL
jgi:Holliday junction resolvasome RuvABC endonuclease subunit